MDNAFTIYIGDSVSQQLQLTQNGLPVDLTSITNIACTLQNDPSQTAATQTFSLSGGSISVQMPAAQGLFVLGIDPYESEQLLAQDDVDVDFVATENTSVLVTTGTTALGSNQLTTLASTTGVKRGQLVSGTGIPLGTYVEAISGNTVTLSQVATAAGTGVAVTFSSQTVQTYRVKNGLSIKLRAPTSI